MIALPRSLGARLALASLGAVLGVLTLQQLVRAPARAATHAPARAPAAPSPLAAIGFRVTPVAGDVLLCARTRAVPPGAAPVLQVLADGRIVAVRAPVDGARAAAILAPRGPGAAWTPASRAALLEALAAMLPARPLPASRVRAVDLVLARADLDALCRWVP